MECGLTCVRRQSIDCRSKGKTAIPMHPELTSILFDRLQVLRRLQQSIQTHWTRCDGGNTPVGYKGRDEASIRLLATHDSCAASERRR